MSKKKLEAKLSIQQRKAAYLLVENDLEMTDMGRLTQDEVADQVGCGRTTLYRWRTQDDNFIEFMNLLADDYFRAKRSFAYRQLIRTISGSQPSIKGLDLYFKRFGLLTEKHEIVNDTIGRSTDDLRKGMEELDDLLDDDQLELIEEIELDEENLRLGSGDLFESSTDEDDEEDEE